MTQGIILFAHGSRDPAWRGPMDAVAARIRLVDPAALVWCAFLELMSPDLPAAVEEMVIAGARDVRIVPMFLGMGRHVREDLPALVDALATAHPEVSFLLAPAVGEDPRMIALMADIATG